MWQNYIMAETLDEAVEALAQAGDSARIIAGGTDLILEIERGVRPNLKTIIDISKIPGLDSITEDPDGTIHLGPTVTHNHVVGSPLIHEKAFALVQACWEVGSPKSATAGLLPVTWRPLHPPMTPSAADGLGCQINPALDKGRAGRAAIGILYRCAPDGDGTG